MDLLRGGTTSAYLVNHGGVVLGPLSWRVCKCALIGRQFKLDFGILGSKNVCLTLEFEKIVYHTVTPQYILGDTKAS